MNLAAFSRFVLRHKLLVAAFWIVATAVGIASSSAATGALSQRFDLPGSESTEANLAIVQTYGSGGFDWPLVATITLPPGITVDTTGIREQLSAAFARVTGAVPQARVASYASTGDRTFVSADGRTTFGLIYLPSVVMSVAGGGQSPTVPAVKAALADVRVADATFDFTGINELTASGREKNNRNDNSSGSNSSLLVESLIGAGGALLVLAWVFGSFLALLPVLMAAVAIFNSFLLLWGLASVTDISYIVQYLITLIGLGIAIDYSLLIVTRWREERARGLDNASAVQKAMETAGHSVLFSGTTVTISLFALVALPLPFLRSVGLGGMLIPLVSVLVALTLLPVLLATIGPRLDWPRFRRGDQASPVWERLSRLVVRQRWAAAAIAVAILAALTIPVLSIQLGQPSADALAQSGSARRGLVALEDAGIGAGVLTPYEVFIQGAGVDPNQVAATLSKVDGIRAAVAPIDPAWRRGDTALVVAYPVADANTDSSALAALRQAAHSFGQQGQVLVGGVAAAGADFISVVYGNFPLMLAVIVLVTFVLLVRAFRSLLLPLKAVILNVVSVAAAYGVLVLVWQEGYGSQLIWNTEATRAITSWIPIMVFAFLFGLSMDYEVFIMTRMREEYDATGSTSEAVVRGMSHTGVLVTSAALILFLAFGALAAVPDTSLRIMATGLAAGILLDATVIRALLVPALVSLMGKWNWWLPSWLAWFAVAVPTTQTSEGVAEMDRNPETREIS